MFLWSQFMNVRYALHGRHVNTVVEFLPRLSYHCCWFSCGKKGYCVFHELPPINVANAEVTLAVMPTSKGANCLGTFSLFRMSSGRRRKAKPSAKIALYCNHRIRTWTNEKRNKPSAVRSPSSHHYYEPSGT